MAPKGPPASSRAAGSPKEKRDCKKRGWNEIESLFDGKKKEKREKTVQESKERKSRKAILSKQRDAEKRGKNLTSEDYNRGNASVGSTGKWVDDGLGGKFNQEGFTGRVEDGMKIFKAHVLSKPDAGKSASCPFDCNCCYI